MDGLPMLCVPVALFLWARWFLQLRTSGLAPVPRIQRVVLGIFLPLTCAVFLYLVLARLSSADVRSDMETIAQYLALGLAWIAGTVWVFGFLGVSMRDDVIERRNPAAGFVLAGQLIAATCCFAGANIGDGPGAEVVLFCATLATLFVLLLWLVFDRIAWITDAVTIERNVFTGMRVAGWLAATGIVAGGAVAGDWHSAGSTLRDFVSYAWPAALATILVALFERNWGKHSSIAGSNRAVSSGLAALAYVVLAALYVYKRGLF